MPLTSFGRAPPPAIGTRLAIGARPKFLARLIMPFSPTVELSPSLCLQIVSWAASRSGGTSGTQTLDLGRFNLTLNGPNTSVVSANGHIDMLLNCAILGSGNLTVNGTLNWSNGALNAGGVITIEIGGVLAIGPNNVTLARTVNNGGAATWVGGNLAMSASSAFN